MSHQHDGHCHESGESELFVVVVKHICFFCVFCLISSFICLKNIEKKEELFDPFYSHQEKD
jgi:hypothetical protein